jgi:hypothetical protein
VESYASKMRAATHMIAASGRWMNTSATSQP